MSKINIYFNDKYYLVDEESFSSASTDLQSHLSNVMNGSGAMINFKGTSYNIDSTKLSNVTNDFISYLGTIVGNGRKIKVGGVEYSIDLTKLSNAISELETVLGNSNSGDSDGLNEYGFYFNRPYKSEIMNFDGVDARMIFTFYKNGDVNMKIEGVDGTVYIEELASNRCKYEQYKIIPLTDSGNDELMISNNGKTLSGVDMVLSLDESYNLALNEYGFYFNNRYSYTDDDTYFHVTFYEDGNTITVYDFTPSGGNVHNYMGTWSINANGELEIQFDNNSNSIKTVNISNNGETLSWVLEDSSVENTVVNLEK